MTRNIVLVTLDSLRADHCSYMGYLRETTPTMDDLAAEGVVFENAVASGVPTIASMTSVMTGEYSFASPEIGFNKQQREQLTSSRTVAETLHDAGYATGALSPNPPASSYFGFDAGFDWFEDFLAEERGLVERVWNRIHQRSIEGGRAATYLRLIRNVISREEVLRPWEAYYDDIIEWCQGAERPYFLWVLLLEPHHPWFPPADSQRWSTRRDVYRSFYDYYRMLAAGWTPDFSPAERQRLIDLYDDSIRHGDRFLQRLRGDLADDDPIFIVHADHGEEFGEHGRFGHQPFLFENLTHVPLIIANIGESRTVSRPVELRSLAPTISELADVPHAFRGDGLLSGPPRPWAVSKVFAGGQRRLSLRTRGYKFHSSPDQTELYDLRVDPDEQVDVSGDRPEACANFEAALDHHVSTETEIRAIGDAVEGVVR